MALPQYGIYDVTAYGALGNGTHDDAPNIRSAETACEATGGIVYFPPGTYLIKSQLSIAAGNVTWQGAGAGASVIKADTSMGIAESMVSVGATGGVADVLLTDLGFRGNGVNAGLNNPPGKDAISIGASGGLTSFVRIVNCKFFNTTAGSTVHFWNTTDGEVSGCHFYQVGYDNGVLGDSNITPAVFVGSGCVAVRVCNNHFEQCFYDGIRIAGNACIAYSNYAIDCKGSSIDVGVQSGDGDGTRLFGNYVESTQEITSSNQGVYIQELKNFQLVGNIVTKSDNSGIAGGGCSFGAYVGTVVFNNAVSHGVGTGLEGLQYIAQTQRPNPNKAITFAGNIACDQRSSPLQENGFRMFSGATNPIAQDFALVGNSLWGNPNAGINIDALVFNDNSDLAIANGSWLDRQHQPAKTLTGTTAKSLLVASSPVVLPYSMERFNGLRIVASGKTTSGGTPSSRKFYLGLHSSGNIMPAFNAGSSDSDWQLEAYIVNDGSFTAQKGFVHFFYGGSLVYHSAIPNPGVTTSSQASVLLEGMLSNAGDSIVTDFLTVERV